MYSMTILYLKNLKLTLANKCEKIRYKNTKKKKRNRKSKPRNIMDL